MSALERLKDGLHTSEVIFGKNTVLAKADLALALDVIDKAIGTSETAGDDMDRALEELWLSVEALTKS